MKSRNFICRTYRTLFPAIVALGAFATAHAQTCASPLSLPANAVLTHSTCSDPVSLYSLAGGAIVSTQKDSVYRFTTTSPPYGDTVVIWPSSGSFKLLAQLSVDSCSSYALAEWIDQFWSSPLVVPVNPRTGTHDYYVVVTGDPGNPWNDCGAFSIMRTSTAP